MRTRPMLLEVKPQLEMPFVIFQNEGVVEQTVRTFGDIYRKGVDKS